MNTIEERLDGVKSLLQDPDFLAGNGLSNEVNIRIFCYEAEDEMAVRHFISQLASDQSLPCHLEICDLYDMLIRACEKMDILDAIPEMEEEEGEEFLLDQLRYAIGEDQFIEQIRAKQGSVLLLTGVGKVFPFMRLHSLLEALQPHFSQIPVLAMYPGKFDKHSLQLFGRLTPNDYYRAFSVI